MSDTNGGEVILRKKGDERGVDRRRFFGVIAAATTLLLILLTIALVLGAVGSLGLGIGGFIAEFSGVEAPSGAIYPTLAEQSRCDSAPQILASLEGKARIHGYFTVSKNIPTPVGPEAVTVEVTSEAGNQSAIVAENAELRLTALTSTGIDLADAEISETGPGDLGKEPGNITAEDTYVAPDMNVTGKRIEEVEAEFGIRAEDGFGIRRGKAVVRQITFDSISLGSISLSGETQNSEDVTLVGDYNCTELEPPERDPETGEFRAFDKETANTTLIDAPAADGEPIENAQPAGIQQTEAAPSRLWTVPTPVTREWWSPGLDGGTAPPPPRTAEFVLDVRRVSPAVDAVPVGERISIVVEVTNIGMRAGERKLHLDVRNLTGTYTSVRTTKVSLGPGESAVRTLGYEATPTGVPEVSVVARVGEPDEIDGLNYGDGP